MPFLTKTNKRKKTESIHAIKTSLECSSSSDIVTNLKDTNNNSINKKAKIESNTSNDSNQVAEIPTFSLKEKPIEDILKEKEETLRRLKLVEHYKTKVFY